MTSVAAQLTQDHQELDSLLRCLAQDAKAPLPGTLQPTWARFETQLVRHMDAEERFLLPLLTVTDPAEVARIRVEHERIRSLLAELGVAVELHLAREANVSELIELLEAHAKHENGALYRLTSGRVTPEVERGIAQLIGQGVANAASAVSSRLGDKWPAGRRARP